MGGEFAMGKDYVIDKHGQSYGLDEKQTAT